MPTLTLVRSLRRAARKPLRFIRRQVAREERLRLHVGLAALDRPGHHPHRVCGAWAKVQFTSPAHDPLEQLWRLPAYRAGARAGTG